MLFIWFNKDTYGNFKCVSFTLYYFHSINHKKKQKKKKRKYLYYQYNMTTLIAFIIWNVKGSDK